ncbi:uncharacterized protein PV06_02182 [Exophiala oligosperma]|uniref:Uncharacterized protein n=1 Tax=Exophiala oligosperma TaxID=215243 RepID=A0A0D2EF24_9EURO|nr:uncharacterized protein PV06_02182 [Exophiala oligosperma]KIW46514.1 hypothetical protein PV06_02182 [Exophiala oligosperma]
MDTAIVDGALFHSCLQSIPLNQTSALDLLDALEPYIELQSTLDHLSAPPDDWAHSPVDVKASLKSLADDVVSGGHKSEYTFQTALYKIFLSARDAHFNFIPDLFGIGSFKIPGASLVSVSTDPKEKKPIQIYFVSDVLEITIVDDDDDNVIPILAWIDEADRLAYTPSPITSINGIPVDEFMVTRLDQSAIPFHDPHAAYNHLFFEISQLTEFDLSTAQGAFPNPVFYPGPEMVFGFDNGTIIRIQTTAEVHADFDRVYDGRSAYEKFCNWDGDVVVSDAPDTAKENSPHTTKEDEHEHEHETTRPESEFVMKNLPFYPPSPIFTDTKGRMTGYFVDDFDDSVAVLVILDFSVYDDATEFQLGLSQFLETCRSLGKTKLIIDLFGNGGGTLELGVDAARRIFPDMEYEIYGNMRKSDVLKDLSEGYYHYSYNSHASAGTTRIGNGSGADSLFDIRSLLDIDGKAWGSWDEFYGSESRSGSNELPTCRGQKQSTSPFRINCTATAPRGLQGRRHTLHNNTRKDEGFLGTVEPVFEPESVVILTDGFCASTCAVFVELLLSTRKGKGAGTTTSATEGKFGAKSVVVGGIPPRGMDTTKTNTRGYLHDSGTEKGRKMQILGTTKGAAFWRFREILETAESVKGGISADPRDGRFLDLTDRLRRFTDLPLRRTKGPNVAGVNGVNHFPSYLFGNGDSNSNTEKDTDTNRMDHRGNMTPLQFVPREADLRIYPTKEMVVDKRTLWKRVSRVFDEP